MLERVPNFEISKKQKFLAFKNSVMLLTRNFQPVFLIEPDTDLYNLTDDHFKDFDFELDLSENKLGKIDLANFSNCRDFRNGSDSLFSLDLSHNHIWSVKDSREDNTQIVNNVSLSIYFLTSLDMGDKRPPPAFQNSFKKLFHIDSE